MSLVDVSFLVLVVLLPIGLLDGIWIHLWKLQLHRRPESRREHVLHTWRALLLVPILFLLYGADRSGPLLWAGIALALVDEGVEIADMWSERASRMSIGGLSSFEYVLHGLAITLKTVSLTLLLVAKDGVAWTEWSFAAQPYSELSATIYSMMWPGAFVLVAVHVWLLRAPHGQTFPVGAQAATG